MELELAQLFIFVLMKRLGITEVSLTPAEVDADVPDEFHLECWQSPERITIKLSIPDAPSNPETESAPSPEG